MKYSANRDDKEAYQNYITLLTKCKYGQKVCVYLDNNRINEVVLADDVEGWVVIPKKGANNQLMVDGCGNLTTETIYGKVEVKIG